MIHIYKKIFHSFSNFNYSFSTTVLLVAFTIPPIFTAHAEDWKFNATPYAWLAGVSGDVSARGKSVSFDKSFGDLVSDVNAGAMGRFEATNDALILTTDLTYIDLGTNKDVRSTNISAEMDQTILELGGGYYVGDFCLGKNAGSTRVKFDALAGARYFDADTTIKGPFGRDPSTSLSYWEPYIGPRLTVLLNDRWSTGVRTDIGGFGIGNDPELSWQFTAGVKYQATKLLSVDFGYKFLNIYDLDRKDASADIKMGGLILGTGFIF